MEFKVVSVKDEAMEEYLQPMFVHTDEEAKRMFNYQLHNNPIWSMNSDQFTLTQLGVLDTITGKLVENFSVICKGVDLLPKKGE